MKHKILYVGLGVFMCVLAGTAFLNTEGPINTKTAEAAKRSFVLDGELYLVSEEGDSQKMLDGRNIKAVYGETSDNILIGKTKGVINNTSSGVNLFLVRKDGSEMKKVTDEMVEFALLDTGKKYVIYLTLEGKIKRKNIETEREEELANLASIPSISPDDKYLAYKKMPEGWTAGEYTDGSPGIVIKDIATGKERVIADQEADHAAYWTPDGKYLYFFGDNGFGLDSLFVIDSEGKNRTLLTNINIADYNPDKVVPSISEPPIISKDGRYFVYESDREIWLIDIDLGNKKVNDAKRIGFGVSPAWEKDGETISIVFGGNGQKSKASVVTVDLEGNIISQ